MLSLLKQPHSAKSRSTLMGKLQAFLWHLSLPSGKIPSENICHLVIDTPTSRETHRTYLEVYSPFKITWQQWNRKIREIQIVFRNISLHFFVMWQGRAKRWTVIGHLRQDGPKPRMRRPLASNSVACSRSISRYWALDLPRGERCKWYPVDLSLNGLQWDNRMVGWLHV